MTTEASMVAEDLLTRTRNAVRLLTDCVEVNLQKRGGVPVLKGTRFTVAQLLAEVAAGRSVPEIAEDFNLERNLIERLLDGLALSLDGPL